MTITIDSSFLEMFLPEGTLNWFDPVKCEKQDGAPVAPSVDSIRTPPEKLDRGLYKVHGISVAVSVCRPRVCMGTE